MVSSLLARVYGRALSAREEERVKAAVPEVEWLADCVAMGPAWMQAPAHMTFFSELGWCLIRARSCPAEAHVVRAKASNLCDGARRAAVSLQGVGAGGGDASAVAAAEAHAGFYMAKIAELVATRALEIEESEGHRSSAPSALEGTSEAQAAEVNVLESLVRSPQPPCAGAEVLVLEAAGRRAQPTC